MHSVRRRLSLILIVCTIAAVILTALFVNIAMTSTFNKYLNDVQDKRNERIVEYLSQIYQREGKWNKSSGGELMHEAYMSNYCLTLLDENNNVVWGMDPNEIKNGMDEHMMMTGEGKGVYSSKTFNINVDNKVVGYAVIGQYYPVILSEQDINFKNSINKSIAFSALITILIVGVIGLTISKQFSSPIKRVSDISMELSKGNYESRSNIKSKIIEINNLINSVNLLGEKLKNQDLLRKRLVSDISHEVRTPLNILQNNLEAMIDGILPITDERLTSLNDEVIRFGKLLDNLNSLKKFDTEDLSLNIEKIFLKNLLQDICNDFKETSKEKNIDISLSSKAEENYMILGDEDRLKQVFINLISNAIKFSNNGGKVWIRLKESRDKVMVEIKDNGIGIIKEDLPYVFERLYRGDKSRHETEGNGIGLTIVKRILSLHAADIEVQSEMNEGTTFTLYFNKPEKDT